MKVYVFKGKGKVFGFTRDDKGANLPAEPGPWSFFKVVDMDKGAPLIGVDTRAALEDIERDGFYIGGAEIRVEEGPA